MARYRFCSFYFAAERLWKALDFHRARKGGQKQEDQIQVQRTFDRRTGELNGSLSVLLVLLRCRTIMESARFSPQIDHAGRRMDSKVVNQGIRGRIWPRLRERGFGTFSSRSAWRHRSDRIEVVNFQSFNAYNAGVIGCTTFSFAVNLGCYLLAIPPRFEPSRIKATKGHLVPEEFACHFRGQLSPDIPQPKLRAKNIWFIDETGSNLALSLDDAWAALDGSGLPWFEQFASPAEVLRILRHEPEQQGRLWGF